VVRRFRGSAVIALTWRRRTVYFNSDNVKEIAMVFVRRFASTIALATVLFSSLFAQTPQPSPTQPTTQEQQRKSKPKCTDNGTYVNSQGQTVKRPENCSAAPKGATAQCGDGSYSFSQSRRVIAKRMGEGSLIRPKCAMRASSSDGSEPLLLVHRSAR
jgi:Protein of unknown function (DUF3761)